MNNTQTYNYFPEQLVILPSSLYDITDTTACMTEINGIQNIIKCSKQRWWKICIIDHVSTISKLSKMLKTLNTENIITTPNILYAICFENNKYNIIWLNDEIKQNKEQYVTYIAQSIIKVFENMLG